MTNTITMPFGRIEGFDDVLKLEVEDHDCKSGCPCGLGNDDDLEPIVQDDYAEYQNREVEVLNNK